VVNLREDWLIQYDRKKNTFYFIFIFFNTGFKKKKNLMCFW
jgi:hypothetical protein